MLHAVIMAGGAGTRFWPESRAALPKQLLDLLGGRTMIQATFDRLAGLVPRERVSIITADVLVDAVAAQLPQLPAGAVVGEPCKRDTAPCIGLAAHLVSRDDPDAVMAVLPADHVIGPTEKFQAAMRHAVALVEESPGRIVTFGIRPTYPAESFGYIERAEPLAASGIPSYRVARFREKPRAEVAAEYVATGRFYWNSGIFVWRAATILAALAEHQPQMAAHLETIASAFGRDDFAEVFAAEFAAIRGVSIDYAVMEHARDVAVVEAPYEWDDVGSWQALARLRGADAEGNTVSARHVGLDTHGCIIRGTPDHLVATLGIDDCIIVQTPDATLVAHRSREESLRELVKLIQHRGWGQHL
ncbi:MAG: NTP transferase domain-containing protein [Pirellulales bacterium]|nr:NTP transferase domain-containing protein [Pirellulales bacterium]